MACFINFIILKIKSIFFLITWVSIYEIQREKKLFNNANLTNTYVRVFFFIIGCLKHYVTDKKNLYSSDVTLYIIFFEKYKSWAIWTRISLFINCATSIVDVIQNRKRNLPSLLLQNIFYIIVTVYLSLLFLNHV